MQFKRFEIRRPTIIGKQPNDEYFKYNFDLVCWDDPHSHCWSIGHLEYDRKEGDFEFRSCGLRYLQYREEGLEEWLMKWCELKRVELRYNEEE